MPIEFRDLRADEIDVRVQSIKDKGLSLLLYKNARCDMNILDETVGPENWQRDHYDCKGNLFCRVGINCHMTRESGLNSSGIDHYQEWIWKSDCGTESNMDKQKGEASDSFKRACFNWGIGRELYTAPFIWVKANDCNIKTSGNKFICNDKFVVSKIKIENKKIIELEIFNEDKDKTVFKMNGGNTKQADEPKAEKPKADIICPKCGKAIQPAITSKGAVWNAKDILNKYGMCGDCYKKAKANEKTDVQT